MLQVPEEFDYSANEFPMNVATTQLVFFSLILSYSAVGVNIFFSIKSPELLIAKSAHDKFQETLQRKHFLK